MSKRWKGLPQILLLPIQYILVHIYPYDYNLPVTCSKCSSNCCFTCIQSKVYYRLKKRESCHGKEGRLPRITDWMTWILGWQSQNNWIIWGYTEGWKQKNQLESMDMWVLPRTVMDVLIRTERKRLRHLFDFFPSIATLFAAWPSTFLHLNLQIFK